MYGAEPDVRIWRARWARRNGCRSGASLSSLHEEAGEAELPKPTSITYPFPNTTLEVWDGGRDGSKVVALSISNLGHAWPTLDGRDEFAAPNAVAPFDFTLEYLLDFFSAHELPERFCSHSKSHKLIERPRL